MKRMRDTLLTIGLAVLGLLLVPAVASMVFAAATPIAQAQTMCTMQYDPVCASKQVQCIKAPCYPVYQTYGNACMAAGDGALILHRGECLPHETGPVIPQPPPAPVYTPPATCVSWYDGCNSCTKTAKGVVCTKRYCSPEYVQSGYCTVYQLPPPLIATSTPPVVIPPVYYPPRLPWWLWWWQWRWW